MLKRNYLILFLFLIFISCFSTKKKDSKSAVSSPVAKEIKPIPFPDSSRYTAMVLAQGLDEPVGMDIMPNNNVLFVERKGGVKLYDASKKVLKSIAHVGVFTGIEDGLLGVALDPDYSSNNWVYLYYSVQGEKAINRLSRFSLQNDNLNFKSEKILLEIPTQRKYCCHSAGALLFGPNKLLYIATGDNTNAEEAEGYIPIDERPGRELADAQGTTANSNDLRGKILRIKPESNGTYSIPDGNLFPKDGSKGRPEIYVMGTRNPYRLSIDSKTGFLYWGDVGPATKVPGNEGMLSYDEINQARQAGFFGWPYFLGENEAFPHYNFETKTEGPKFNPDKPVNNSRNNTGVRELPPAQPAMIWYGRLPSVRFPLVGKGGATAMAGPVYYSDLYPNSKYKLSEYYNGKFFIYDWVRRWIMAVTLDENGKYVSMEPFLNHLKLAAPMDMKIGADGALYLLEYGTNWFSKNMDARLMRIEYSEGNRNPIAKINIDQQYGSAPMQVTFSSKGSKDYDAEDILSYEWIVDGKKFKDQEVKYTFTSNGVYDIVLNVYDNKGGVGTSSVQIKVGNTPPFVNISSSSNTSFFWDNAVLDYSVLVSDKEDGAIDKSKVHISFNYFDHASDMASGFMEESTVSTHIKGMQMVANLDCRACHSLDQTSIGPKYKDIAKRYAGKPGAEELLKEKIIKGGKGNWGSYEMPPHPDMSAEDVKDIVDYILSVNKESKKLPMAGKIPLKDHQGKGPTGGYLLTASYKDNGANNIEPLFTRSQIALRSPLVQVEDYDGGNLRIGTITTAFLSYARTRDKGFIKYNKIDLSNISSLRYQVQSNGAGGKVELRTDSITGPVISSLSVEGGVVSDLKTNWKEVEASVKPTKGIKDLYFVFSNPAAGSKTLFNIDWIYFNKK